jgi:hypothetical protein
MAHFTSPLLGYIIFWFIGILVGSIEGYFYFEKQQLQKHGITTTGTVIDYYYGRSERTAPIVEFVVNGKTYVYHHPTATSGNTIEHPIGSPMDIVYLPENPEIANLKAVVESNLVDIVLFSIAGLFLIIPTLIYLRRHR